MAQTLQQTYLEALLLLLAACVQLLLTLKHLAYLLELAVLARLACIVYVVRSRSSTRNVEARTASFVREFAYVALEPLQILFFVSFL